MAIQAHPSRLGSASELPNPRSCRLVRLLTSPITSLHHHRFYFSPSLHLALPPALLKDPPLAHFHAITFFRLPPLLFASFSNLPRSCTSTGILRLPARSATRSTVHAGTWRDVANTAPQAPSRRFPHSSVLPRASLLLLSWSCLSWAANSLARSLRLDLDRMENGWRAGCGTGCLFL